MKPQGKPYTAHLQFVKRILWIGVLLAVAAGGCAPAAQPTVAPTAAPAVIDPTPVSAAPTALSSQVEQPQSSGSHLEQGETIVLSEFSPQGDVLAVAVEQIVPVTPSPEDEEAPARVEKLKMFRTDDLSLVWSLQLDSQVTGIRFSPGGAWVAFWLADGTVIACETAGGAELIRVAPPPGVVTVAAVFRDETSLAILRPAMNIQVADLNAPGAPLQEYMAEGGLDGAYVQDGDWLVVLSCWQFCGISMRKAAENYANYTPLTFAFTEQNASNQEIAMVVSPDGSLAALLDKGGRVAFADISNPPEQSLVRIVDAANPQGGFVRRPSAFFLPGNEKFFFASGESYSIIDIATGQVTTERVTPRKLQGLTNTARGILALLDNGGALSIATLDG